MAREPFWKNFKINHTTWKDIHRAVEQKRREAYLALDQVYVKEEQAMICADCSTVFGWERSNGVCPRCGSRATMPARPESTRNTLQSSKSPQKGDKK